MTEAMLDLLEDPDWFLFHLEGDRAYFVQMSREAYGNTIFCDSRIQPVNRKILPVRLDALMEAFETVEMRERKVCFIFHMAHVGSTLLSRCLDLPGTNVVLREPQALRQLGVSYATHMAGGGGQNEAFTPRRLLSLAMYLFGKSYGSGQTAIIKANVPVNFLIQELVAECPLTPSIFLYAGLEDYVLALHKTEEHKQWVFRILEELGPGWARISGMESAELDELDLSQSIACIWLVQLCLFANAIPSDPEFRALDSETFFARPRATLTAAFELFRQDVGSDRLDKIVRGDALSRHAKNPGVEYNNDLRMTEKRTLANRLERELETAREWVQAHVHNFATPNGQFPTLALERAALLDGYRGDES